MRTACIGTCALLALSACASASFSDDTQQKLQKILDDSVETYGPSGMVLGVWQADKGSWLQAKGIADPTTQRAADVADTYRIASITKTFVGSAILMLVDKGSLSLDAKIGEFVTGLPNGDKVTIRHLLTQTSGLFEYLADDEVVRLRQQYDQRYRKWTQAEIVAVIAKHPVNFEPGAQCEYTNTNYYLLGMVVEKVTGDTLEKQIQALIIDRLKLTATSFPTGPQMTGSFLRGYGDMSNSGTLQDWTEVDPSWTWGAGAMVSNAQDLKTYVEAMVEGGLLGADLQKQRLETSWTAFGDPADHKFYGLGLMKSGTFYYHSGELAGYMGIAANDPARKLTIVTYMNRFPHLKLDEGTAGEKVVREVAKLIAPDASF